MTSRLAIIHPEGNFNNNPNLSGLLSLFSKEWDAIDIYAQPHEGIDQSSPDPKISVVLRSEPPGYSHDTPVLLPSVVRANFRDAAAAVAQNLSRPDFIIGVDRGIIEARALSKIWGCPIGLISYEIFFAAETSDSFKSPEIASCQDLTFAVCQDRARSANLARENQIPLDKILDIPVADTKVQRGPRSTLLKSALSLTPETRVALYMGELSGTWNGIDEILESTSRWPAGWVLVLHHRYGNSSALDLVARVLSSGRKNVLFSPFPTLPFERMGDLLFGVDLGFAFYRPVPGHPTSNQNLATIGMASGKISTYLQYGVPIVVNELGEISEHVRANKLGGVVRNGSEIPQLLQRFSEEPGILDSNRCWDFFSTTLDVAVRARPLLEIMRTLRS